MALEQKNITFEDTSASYGAEGGGKVLMEGHMVTTDAPAAVEAAGYFNGVAYRMYDGAFAIIDAVMSAGGVPVLKRYVLIRNGAVVTAITAT
jgi:hypothetical protein